MDARKALVMNDTIRNLSVGFVVGTIVSTTVQCSWINGSRGFDWGECCVTGCVGALAALLPQVWRLALRKGQWRRGDFRPEASPGLRRRNKVVDGAISRPFGAS